MVQAVVERLEVEASHGREAQAAEASRREAALAARHAEALREAQRTEQRCGAPLCGAARPRVCAHWICICLDISAGPEPSYRADQTSRSARHASKTRAP